MAEKVTIDGSLGEGGGQILRTSAALAAITGREVQIVNIRAGRKKPGLQPQHLAAMRAAAQACGGELTGDAVGSLELTLRPGATDAPTSPTLSCDIGTAGATTLVLQTVLLPCLLRHGEASIAVRGGTHVPMAPTADYIEGVFVPALQAFGVEARTEVRSLGFYPKGGGELVVTASMAGPLIPVRIDAPGRTPDLAAYVSTAQLPDHVAERGARAVESYLKARGRKADLVVRRLRSNGAGAAVMLAAAGERSFAGFSSLGKQGLPMEAVAETACAAFMEWTRTGAACDEHLADQLVLPAALAPGESCWTAPMATEHLRTVLTIVEAFLPIRWGIEPTDEGSVRVRVQGAAPA